jgi:hypothetical protein
MPLLMILKHLLFPPKVKSTFLSLEKKEMLLFTKGVYYRADSAPSAYAYFIF